MSVLRGQEAHPAELAEADAPYPAFGDSPAADSASIEIDEPADERPHSHTCTSAAPRLRAWPSRDTRDEIPDLNTEAQEI